MYSGRRASCIVELGFFIVNSPFPESNLPYAVPPRRFPLEVRVPLDVSESKPVGLQSQRHPAILLEW